ncbi:hypothetical protein TRM7557_03236 [Tritonibacter multivorans]|uniref:DUF1127 domain-containing protein n=1 Tax=Tritonibacter multivorans TaxID=928856 RepID=A0A0P1GGR2_9RHOB|nr:hypothetical protein [Tritonibacter multivorans]MDA7420704.1 hypothetical protein [Tritonibacter multivorans]CUH81094.1 hypothetical protein TRM7557_03236 [Tritonibacter multivorans]SFC28100.1 hypothetical protein SAMN04488049_10272 [Tritonibacter multivorans]
MPRSNSLRAHARRGRPSLSFSRAYRSVISLWDQCRNRRHLRRALRQLRFAPDEALRDAGWSREDLLQEIAKPCWRA